MSDKIIADLHIDTLYSRLLYLKNKYVYIYF